jgi:Ca2+-transporting ATPase
MTRAATTPWHSLSTDEVLTRCETREHGLTAQEVVSHRRRFEVIEAPQSGRRPILPVILKQLASPFVLLLAGAALLSLLTGETKDAIVVLIVIIANTTLGTVFEIRSGALADALKEKLHHKTVVRRDGKLLQLPYHKLAVGDIVLVQAGSAIVADMRILSATHTRADESSLTGESLHVAKHAETLDEHTPLAERKNMLYAGTTVTAGTAVAVVVGLGTNTELGTIATSVAMADTPDSPLIQQTRQLNKVVGGVAVSLGVIVCIALWVQGSTAAQAFQLAAALMVAAVPEGLPVMVTTCLILGVSAMAKQQALVKDLSALETLAHVTTIVTDKTGTLTRNHVVPEAIFITTPESLQEISIDKLDPFISGVKEILTASVLANEAARETSLAAQADQLETALLEFAHAIYPDSARIVKSERLRALLPFSSDYKLMAASYAGTSTGYTTYAKGAPEAILARADSIVINGTVTPLTDAHRSDIHNALQASSGEGKKVLAFAGSNETLNPKHHLEAQLAALHNLTFFGMISLSDELRDESRSTVHQLQQSGISLKVASGDHMATTRAIAHAVGMPVRLLEKPMEEASAAERARSTVFARVSPLDKLTLVRTLQKRGEVVAMVGDGTNDAPALKQADVGVALGGAGNDVSRGAASIILLNDSLRTVLDAITRGRAITVSIQAISIFFLLSNATEAISITIATITGGLQLLAPGQILVLNLLSDTPLALPFLFEPAENNQSTHGETTKKRGLFSNRTLITNGILAATGLLLGVLVITLAALQANLPLPVLQSLVLITMVGGQVCMLLALRHQHHSVFTRSATKNQVLTWVIVAVAGFFTLVSTVPALGSSLSLATPPLAWLLFSAICSFGTLLLPELAKYNHRRALAK